ncbi:hypothetical protein COU37_01810 [Candidatus Micrarchaeota archaeon CG10_big_fil_rev_8_21_14_0_10_45_29]|nr:MAG: hypothetical protein COU37_01810 [Candidatus Micrarchaeota archaeon CG10_big_fil_rev_8_21_14_0_10_45_29]
MDKNLAIKLNSALFGLDVKGGEINYISHAHSDHSYAMKDSAPIFCSDATAQMLSLDFNGKNKEETEISPNTKTINKKILTAKKNIENKESPLLKEGAKAHPAKENFSGRQNKISKRKKASPKRIQIPNGFSLHNAGHILGSTQLCADTQEFGKFVYTGDFKLRDGLTVKKAPIIECDTLVMECTYGKTGVSFPPPQEVYESMEKWSRQNKNSIQLWGGYATGKAQELVKFINTYLDEAPIVPEKVAKICSHYKNNGISLDYVQAGTYEAQEIMRSAFCAVFPPHQLNYNFASQLSHAHRREAKVAIATGWTGIRRMSAHASFPLSDHADFGEILRYAQESGAKKVYLAHGKNESTAKELQKEGINAFAIEELGKKKEMQAILQN